MMTPDRTAELRRAVRRALPDVTWRVDGEILSTLDGTIAVEPVQVTRGAPPLARMIAHRPGDLDAEFTCATSELGALLPWLASGGTTAPPCALLQLGDDPTCRWTCAASEAVAVAHGSRSNERLANRPGRRTAP